MPERQALPTDDPAYRERLQLMRAFDSSPLTKANFCVLKRISVEQLDAQLALARKEAAAWAAAHPQPERPPERGFDRRPDARPPGGGRPEGRHGGHPGGPRRDKGPAQGGAR